MQQDTGRFYELKNARLNRLSSLEKIARLLQPHYRDMLPMVKHRLRKEASVKREMQAKKRRR